MMLIGQSVAKIYLADFADRLNNHPEKLTEYFRDTTLKLITISIVPCILLFFAVPPLVLWVFGEQWVGIEEIIKVLSVLFFLPNYIFANFSNTYCFTTSEYSINMGFNQGSSCNWCILFM